MKEKNLTYLGKADKPTVDGREHEFFEYRTESPFTWVPEYHCDIYGPAIDRLHEFEKIGLEPESIKKAIDNQTAFIGELRERIEVLEKERDALESTTDKFKNQNGRLITSNISLRGKNADLEEKVKNLSHEIDNLVAENKDLIAASKENDELRALNQRLYDKIEDLGHEMDRLISDNKNLKSANETLRHAADNTFDFGGIVHSGNHDYIQKHIDDLVLANNKLQEKNKDLNLAYDEVAELYRDAKYWCDIYTSRNAEQSKTVREYRERNEDLTEENDRLRDNMEQMNKIVGPADFEKEIEDLKSQLKKEVENGQYWHTEAMNHYRKYVNILDERETLQRKLAEIEEIAKEDK